MDKFQVGPWLVAPKLNSLSCNGHTVRVEPKAMQVLVRLAEEKGDPVSKEELIRSVWAETFVTDDVLTRSISELRKAFGDDSRNSQFIETIPRGGYRLASPIVLIEHEHEKGAAAPASDVSHRKRLHSKIALVGAAAMMVALLTIAVVGWLRPAPSQPPSVRAFLPPPTDWIGPWQLALSPDGSKLAFRGGQESPSGPVGALWIQSLATGVAVQIPGTPDAQRYFWSPDSKYIAFCSGDKLQKTDAAGGPVISLTGEDKGCGGGTWGRDGTILFSGKGKILKVGSAGGPVTEVLRPGGRARTVFPWFLPDGRHFLFQADLPNGGREGSEGVYLGDLKTGEQQFLVTSDEPNGPGRAAKYAVGYLLYVRAERLMAQPFDAANLRLAGDPVSLGPIGGAFSANGGGLLAYFSRSVGATDELLWYTREGKQGERLGPPGDYDSPRLAPDGQRVAVSIGDAATSGRIRDIWVFELLRGTASRVTFGKSEKNGPVWSPDGKRLAFDSGDGVTSNLHVKAASGLGEEETLLDSQPEMWPMDWSADGRHIAYVQWPGADVSRLGVLHLTPEKKAGLLLRTRFNEGSCRFSPDGRWFAYHNDETGSKEVYVISYPSLSAKWKVSTEGGTQPIWRRDGKELFYVALDKKIMAVPVTEKGDGLEFGKPVALFESRINGAGVAYQYDVTADGHRFLINSRAQSQSYAGPMTIITNWAALIKK